MKKYAWIIVIILWTIWVITTLVIFFKNSWNSGNTTTQKMEANEQYKIPTPWNTKTNKPETWINTDITTSWTKQWAKQSTKSWTLSKIEIQEEITVLLPDFYFNNKFIKLAEIIKKDRNVKINYQTIQNQDKYKEMIENQLSWYQNIDIFLIPTTRLASFKNQSQVIDIRGVEKTAAYVLSIFQPITDQEKYTFIPFSIDPLISIVGKNTQIEKKKITLSTFLSYLVLSKNKKPFFLPSIIWLNKTDLKFFQKGQQIFSNSADIYYQLFYQITQSKNEKALETLLSFSDKKTPYNRNFINFTKIKKKISTRNPNCQDFPAICLLSYEFSDIKLWYLSEITIRKKYFKTNRHPINMHIYQFPMSNLVYKVRWRWFLPHKKSKKQEAIKIFFQEYLKAGTSNKITFTEDTLSAFNAQFKEQINQLKYQTLAKNQNNFSLIYQWLETQKQFFSLTWVSKLINKETSPQNFLQEIKRER